MGKFVCENAAKKAIIARAAEKAGYTEVRDIQDQVAVALVSVSVCEYMHFDLCTVVGHGNAIKFSRFYQKDRLLVVRDIGL